MDMAVEIRIDWTANQWRRFLGQADMIPIVEQMSIMADRVALVIVEQYLEALMVGRRDLEADVGSLVKGGASSGG